MLVPSQRGSQCCAERPSGSSARTKMVQMRWTALLIASLAGIRPCWEFLRRPTEPPLVSFGWSAARFLPEPARPIDQPPPQQRGAMGKSVRGREGPVLSTPVAQRCRGPDPGIGSPLPSCNLRQPARNRLYDHIGNAIDCLRLQAQIQRVVDIVHDDEITLVGQRHLG